MTFVSVQEFSDLIGYTNQKVADCIKHGMPAGVPGRRGSPRLFDSAAAIAWMISDALAKAGNRDDGESAADADRRRKIAAADMAEMNVSVQAGELIGMAHAERVLNQAMGLVAMQLDGMGGRLAADLAAVTDPALCRQIIFDETRRIRAAAALELEKLASVTDSIEEDSGTAAEDDGEMGGHESEPAAGQRRAGSVAFQSDAVHASDPG